MLEYEVAAMTLKEKNIKIAEVDCVDQAELCRAHDVHGYPCMVLLEYGCWMSLTTYLIVLYKYWCTAATECDGPRKADRIVKYMTKCVISCRVVMQY